MKATETTTSQQVATPKPQTIGELAGYNAKRYGPFMLPQIRPLDRLS